MRRIAALERILTTSKSPDWFTKADIPGQTLPTHDFGITDLDQILKAAERFEGIFMRTGNKIMEMRKFEADGQRTGVVDQAQRTEPVTKATPAEGSTGATTGQITADKVYRVALGALRNAKEMFPGMTVEQMLEQAREHKDIVMSNIESELLKMATPDG